MANVLVGLSGNHFGVLAWWIRRRGDDHNNRADRSLHMI
jgi:hypothetical protein